MMVPKTSLFAGAALLCLGTAATAQQDGPMFRRVTKPLQNASLDLQTGTITRGSAVGTKGLPTITTCSSMSNLDHSGFVGVDSGPGTANGPCEWINGAVKASGKSTYMLTFQFAYCSGALDPASGGTGGTARIGFRTGYVKGSAANAGGPTCTDVGLFGLSGLPANTAASGFFGGFNCYLLTVGTGCPPVVLPDGPIGWSYQFRDLGTDGVLASTFPFLGCVESCTGSGPDSLGMIDYVDQYCPAGSILSTFSFGTAASGGYFTSVSMDIREVEQVFLASNTSFNAGNPVILSGSPPTIGAPYGVGLDCTGANGNYSIVAFRFGAQAPLAFWGGNIIVPPTVALGFNVTLPLIPAPTVFALGSLPCDLAFYGLCFALQAHCDSAGVKNGFASNGLLQTIGML